MSERVQNQSHVSLSYMRYGAKKEKLGNKQSCAKLGPAGAIEADKETVTFFV